MTRRPILQGLLLAVLGTAAAAHAGTVYVPSPGPGTLAGSSYEVQVSVSNAGAAASDVKHVLLANDTDGTARPTPPTTVTVAAGRSAVVKPGAAFRGLFELTGGDDLRYSARLVGTGPGRLGIYLPVITSDNLIAAGKATSLQGLISGSGRATDLTLVNVAQLASQCTASLLRADGTAVVAPVTIALKPLSSLTIKDIFAGGAATEARVNVSCTREYFAFALLSDAATGEIAYVGPAGNGSSLLRVPGQGAVCPPTAVCFDTKGVVHQPSTATPVKRVIYTPTRGAYSKIHMTMDVTIGPWSTVDPSALHMLFWLVKDRNFNMFGYASFRGPDQNLALLRHGIGLTHPQKLKIVQPFTPQLGKTYRLDYTYDTKTPFLELAIYDGTTVVQRLTGQPNVGSFSFGSGENIVIDMGFPGTAPDEAPTFGWVYRDLHLELFK
jgi:hypothetical protein